MFIHVLSARQRCDLELLLTNAFTPLDGYLSQADYLGVLESMRLASGALWPIPVVLDVSAELGDRLSSGMDLRLDRSDGTPWGVVSVTEVYAPDLEAEAMAVYGTGEPTAHPGVAELFRRGPTYVAGPVRLWNAGAVERAAAIDFPPEYRTPAQVRALLDGRPLVAFQTRNPLHHAHIAVTKGGLTAAGPGARLLLHPAIGPTKPGDVEASYRMRVYRAVLGHYAVNQVLLSPLPLSMRMAGPREALWHALIRANYGATHFIVGRGHADPGGADGGLFYPPFAAQDLIEEHRKEIPITPVFLPEFAYSLKRGQYVHQGEAHGEVLEGLSGTELRRRLATGKAIPSWFSPPEVVAILRQAYRGADRRGLVVWFTGLSASGKSTLAGMLAQYLESVDDRALTFLDGDVVRRFLSKGLGFSREDRDENIRRIGFVASLVARHGGIAVVAAISPYREARQEARRLAEDTGGVFLEVYVDTPLDICAERDPKGLYQQAQRGEIRGFTGVDDPYEAPEAPECRLDTQQLDPQDALTMLLESLRGRGVLPR